MAFSKKLLEQTSQQITFYRKDFEQDLPIRIHGYGVDDGHGLGGPPLHPEFERWLGPICFCGRRPDPKIPGDRGCPSTKYKQKSKGYQTESRLRTTKAFRRLRKVAPREFDAVFLMVAHRASFSTVLQSFNERAERLGKPTYRPEDIMLLIVSGIDKIDTWWAS